MIGPTGSAPATFLFGTEAPRFCYLKFNHSNLVLFAFFQCALESRQRVDNRIIVHAEADPKIPRTAKAATGNGQYELILQHFDKGHIIVNG